eukprot:RCo012659
MAPGDWLTFSRMELQDAAFAELHRQRILCCLHLLVESGHRGVDLPGERSPLTLPRTVAKAKEMVLGMFGENGGEWMYQWQALESAMAGAEADPLWQEGLQLVKNREFVKASNHFCRALLLINKQFISDLVTEGFSWVEYYSVMLKVVKSVAEFKQLWDAIPPNSFKVPDNVEDPVDFHSEVFNPLLAEMISSARTRSLESLNPAHPLLALASAGCLPDLAVPSPGGSPTGSAVTSGRRRSVATVMGETSVRSGYSVATGVEDPDGGPRGSICSDSSLACECSSPKIAPSPAFRRASIASSGRRLSSTLGGGSSANSGSSASFSPAALLHRRGVGADCKVPALSIGVSATELTRPESSCSICSTVTPKYFPPALSAQQA